MADLTGRTGTELVLEMGRITRDNLTRDEAMGKIASLLLESFPAEAAAILLYDQSAKSVYVSASASAGGPELASASASAVAGEPADCTLISADITLRIYDDSCLALAAKAPERPTYLPGEFVDSVLGRLNCKTLVIVPMRSGEGMAGFMVLGGCRGELRELSPELLMAVGSQVAIIAAKSSLIESLRQSEERYQMLMENASDLVFLLDRGGRFLYVNGRSDAILGCPPKDVVGRYFGEFITPESWAKALAAVKKASSTKDKYVEYAWVLDKAGGQEISLDVRASLIYSENELFLHQGIARDLSAEMMLKEELVKRDRELGQSKSREERMREYLGVANMAQEEERARIARELHDGAVQYLVALRRRLDLLKREVKTGDPASVDFKDADMMLDAAVNDLREFARNLRPPVLDDFGLVSACEWLADQAEKEGIRAHFSVFGNVRRLGHEIEISAFRIAQEALSNAVKHSGASSVTFSLSFADDALTLSLRDNGRGFEPSFSPGSLVRAGQMGLVGMFERAEILSAAIDLQSEKGRGTSLTVRIPLSPGSA